MSKLSEEQIEETLTTDQKLLAIVYVRVHEFIDDLTALVGGQDSVRTKVEQAENALLLDEVLYVIGEHLAEIYGWNQDETNGVDVAQDLNTNFVA